jgi:hypothetical protein
MVYTQKFKNIYIYIFVIHGSLRTLKYAHGHYSTTMAPAHKSSVMSLNRAGKNPRI